MVDSYLGRRTYKKQKHSEVGGAHDEERHLTTLVYLSWITSAGYELANNTKYGAIRIRCCISVDKHSFIFPSNCPLFNVTEDTHCPDVEIDTECYRQTTP